MCQADFYMLFNVRYLFSFKTSFDVQEERGKYRDKLKMSVMNSTQLNKNILNIQFKITEIGSCIYSFITK